MTKCTTRGCRQLATWEIEIRREGTSSDLYYACDEHCPDPAILLDPPDQPPFCIYRTTPLLRTFPISLP